MEDEAATEQQYYSTLLVLVHTQSVLRVRVPAHVKRVVCAQGVTWDWMIAYLIDLDMSTVGGVGGRDT